MKEHRMRVIFYGLVLALAVGAGVSHGATYQTLIRLAQAPAPGTPSGEAGAPAAPAQKLVGIAAWSQLVGNSITGKEDGETLVEYYAPDGTAKSMTGNEISTGKWALVGETVCFKYTDSDDTECYKIEVMGNFATFIDENGSGTRYEILKGNPNGL
jgi:hypothetical protein